MGNAAKKLHPYKPSDILSVDAEGFMMALQIAQAAMNGRLAMKSPADFGFEFEQSDGEVKQYRLNDISFNRMGLAVAKHCTETGLEPHHVFFRLWAFQSLDPEGPLKKWFAPAEGSSRQVLLHGAVVAAAAEHPLNDDWEFEQNPFFDLVQKIADEYEQK